MAVSQFFLAHALKVGHVSYAFAHVSIETSNSLLITAAAIPLILILLADRSVMSGTGLQLCYRHHIVSSCQLLAKSYGKSSESRAGENIQCNHLSGKSGSVSEFDSCQGNVRKLPKWHGRNLVREAAYCIAYCTFGTMRVFSKYVRRFIVALNVQTQGATAKLTKHKRFQWSFKLSEGDVRLPKLFKQTVPHRWPRGGKTAVIEPHMFSCQQTAKDGGQWQ